MQKFTDESQNKKIENLENCVKDFVNFKILMWIFGILFTLTLSLFGYVLASVETLDSKVESSNHQFIKIETQLSQIQTDLIWIKKELNIK
jgi:hypothetical protein